MKTRHAGAAALALAGGYTAALTATRRWHQHWGATNQEITEPLPGDDLIPAAKLDSTHAITIHAPAERIWPWLAQMGYEDRAGSYSYDLFERSIGRNLYRIDPNIPPLAPGGTMPFYPGAPMTMAVADPPHALVLWQVTAAGKAIDPAGPWGEDYVAWSWAFVLEPVDATTTRLLVHMRVSYQPAARWAPVMWLLVEPAHFVMGRRQLLGLRQRAEAARAPGDHQRTSLPAAGAETAAGVRGGLPDPSWRTCGIPWLQDREQPGSCTIGCWIGWRRRPDRLAARRHRQHQCAVRRERLTDREFRSHPWNGTELPIRPLAGPGSGRSTLGGPRPVVEAAYMGAVQGGNDMAGTILIILAVLFLALLAIAIVYVLGIRSQSSAVRTAARRFHRAVGNPLQLRSAATAGTYASVIRHQGRRTGRTYETPVWAVSTEDGFVIAIVYGSGTDWLKNVLASGAATIVHQGDTYPVDQPEIVPIERARTYFPATLQRTHRLVRVNGCLRVRRVKVAKTSAAQGAWSRGQA